MRRLLPVIGLLLSASAVGAEPVTLSFRGEISHTATRADIAALLPVGTTFSWTITFESDWPDIFTHTADHGLYVFDGSDVTPQQFNWVATFGDYVLRNSSTGSTHLHVAPQDASLFMDTSISGRAVTGAALATPLQMLYPVAMDAGFWWPGATFPGDALPSVFPSGPLTGQFNFLLTTCEGCGHSVDGVRGTFAPAQVPEPSSLALLGVGALVAGMLRRRSRDRH